jgi:hypothetical protein
MTANDVDFESTHIKTNICNYSSNSSTLPKHEQQRPQLISDQTQSKPKLQPLCDKKTL